MSISKKTLTRSALFALFLTLTGMVLQAAKSRLILDQGPPPLGHMMGVTVCYLLAGFTYAQGFFLVLRKLPGRTWITKGLLYGVAIISAVWISGFVIMSAIDFESGWNLLSPVRIQDYWMALCDSLTLLIGGLLLGFIARREGQPLVVARFSGNLALRISAGLVLLPVLCAGIFFLAALALPIGYDLSGGKATAFYVFLFAPLAVSGAGTAPLHDVLRGSRQHGVFAGSFRFTLFLFVMYWVPNALFVLFFGFTWQSLVDFLVAGAISLFLTITVFEIIATPGSARQRAWRVA